jgi:hypothetical protein
VVIVTFIYYNLYRKRQKAHTKKRVEKTLEEWLFKILLEETEEDYTTSITPSFRNYISRGVHRQYVIDQLINSKKNLTGTASQNIIKLYSALGLKEDSIAKMNNTTWHVKAKGIYELYMMHQDDMKETILHYTNSSNEFVRMEAQTAIIGLMGFEGLIFLETLNKPLTNWQQVKLLEQLRPLDLVDMPRLVWWLQSKNEYVVLFALKLAEIYQQMQTLKQVSLCLLSENEKIRNQAIKTIIKIPDETTAVTLIYHYQTETSSNRKHILKGLAEIGTENETNFFLQELNNPDDDIKLEAAKALARCAPSGLELLRSTADSIPDPFQRIFLHVAGRLAS